MDRLNRYFLSRLLILVVLWCTIATFAVAQSFESPGYPWTYVPRQELPAGVLDTAHERSLDTISWLCPDTEIRRLFYVYVHPELTLSDSFGDFQIIVPKEPWLVDTITMQNYFIDTNQRSNYFFASIGGLFSADRPEYATADIELSCFYNSSGDTTCGGYLARLPSTYRFINNLSKTPYTRWLNIVQCVDSIWHPPITSSSKEILIGQMEELVVYPNPVQRGGRIQLKQPDDWPSGPAELVLTGQAGQVLFRRLLAGPPNDQGYSLPPDLAAGMYTLVVLSEGRRAAALVVVQ